MNRRYFLRTTALASGLLVPSAFAASPVLMRRIFKPIAATASTPWTPASDAGLIGWYKSYTGITGNPVTKIDDQKGGYHLDTTTAGPDVITAGLNGLDTIRFNGSSQFIKSTAFPTWGSGTALHVAWKMIAWASGGYVVVSQYGSVSLSMSGISPWCAISSGTLRHNTSGYATGEWRITSAIFGTDGIHQASTTVTGTTGTDTAAQITLGAYGTGAANFSNIEILEVCITSTVTNKDSYRTYLSGVSGLVA